MKLKRYSLGKRDDLIVLSITVLVFWTYQLPDWNCYAQ